MGELAGKRHRDLSKRSAFTVFSGPVLVRSRTGNASRPEHPGDPNSYFAGVNTVSLPANAIVTTTSVVGGTTFTSPRVVSMRLRAQVLRLKKALRVLLVSATPHATNSVALPMPAWTRHSEGLQTLGRRQGTQHSHGSLQPAEPRQLLQSHQRILTGWNQPQS